ncbi:MAG: HEAT repeat domain-containing protein [Thermodesulfobacteriota bacterium]|nr:HEAT repeat domain-containing protein [Thermodesulfobacteriota bacterium]
MSTRKIKKQVLALLAEPDLDLIHKELGQWAAKDVVNALFSGICRCEESVHWHAVSAMGIMVARLANEDMEEGRIIMRRMLWILNDESGGIGWGAPESMAEIMSLHDGLAREYVHMLISYMREDGDEIWQDGNYLEHEMLQQGLLWGAGRLALSRRQLVLEKGMLQDLPSYLDAADGTVRGLAARAMGLLGTAACLDRLQELRTDDFPVRLYEDGRLTTVTVGDLAGQALQRLVD